MLGVVENMSGLRHRLGDFRFLRRDGSGGAEADVTAAVLHAIAEVAPDLLVSRCTDASLTTISVGHGKNASSNSCCIRASRM